MKFNRAKWPIGVAALAGAAILALAPSFSQPAPPADVANGLFAHDCCGTLSLRDGRMTLNDAKAVRYEVARDQSGPYVMPETYVGPFEHKGFEIDGTRQPTKLRLDRLPRPDTIVLIEGRNRFVLKRKQFRPRVASKL
jgi:hypothetical protein